MKAISTKKSSIFRKQKFTVIMLISVATIISVNLIVKAFCFYDYCCALNQIRDSGGHVYYESDYNEDSQLVKFVKFLASHRFVILANINSFGRVVSIDLEKTGVDDAFLEKVLYHFDDLQALSLPETKIGDKSLLNISIHCKNLTILNIDNTLVSDEGLHYLEGLKYLRALHLCDNKITDKGCKFIMNISNITYLNLDDTLVTDNGVTDLEGLSHLGVLSISRTRISKFFLTRLGNFERLRHLISDLEVSNNHDIRNGFYKSEIKMSRD